MHLAVYVALLLALVVAPAGRVATRALAPRPAALALVGIATCSAVSWVWALSLLAATLVNQAPNGAARLIGFRMSQDPVPAWVGLVAALLLGAAGGRLLGALSGELRQSRVIHRVVNVCGRSGGKLLVIADPVPLAFAVPSVLRQPGRIVVSTAMLRALGPEERAVLLAHEQSHLDNRHSWLRAMVTFAAAVHPVLGGLPDRLHADLERWADEDAALAVSNRRVAARSLGRAALASHRLTPQAGGMLGVARRSPQLLPTRVAALLGEAPRSRWLPAVAIGALVIVMTVSVGEASHDLEALFDPGGFVTSVS